jgi:hypothetical protein
MAAVDGTDVHAYAEQLHRDLMEVAAAIDWLRREVTEVGRLVGAAVQEAVDRG